MRKGGKRMTLEEALPLLKQGKKIRMAYWPEGVYLVKCRMSYDEDAEIVEMWTDEDGVAEPIDDYPGAEPWFCLGDLLEEDWEMVE
jgi:hypothetical protein